MIGVELTDDGAHAVAVDGDGRVSKRHTERGSDLVGAALTAVGAVSTPGSPASAAAFVAQSPDSPAPAAALETLIAPDGKSAKMPRSSGVAAAIAEAWVGAARGRKDVAYFATDDHAIAGVLRAGLPVGGASGRVASIAWLALNPVEREDYRKVGCLEAEVAAAGIVRRLIWRMKAGDASQVQDRVAGDLSFVSIQHVLDAARDGDGVSISVMRDTAKYLGMAAANFIALVDPEILILGGIMSSASDLLLEPVRVEIARRLPAAMMDAVVIEPGTLGADAAAIGAARLATMPRA